MKSKMKIQGSFSLCLLFGLCTNAHTNPGSLNPVYQWSQLEFDYPTELDRQNDIKSGNFAPGTIAPIDVEVYYAPNKINRIFVSTPRFQEGVPIAFGTVTEKMRNGNHIIAPYPSWSWHRNPEKCNADRLVSVYRTQVDQCGRLWVLDTGRLASGLVCPAQILAFDLETNQVIHKYEIPADQLQTNSILVTLVVDVRDPLNGCRDTFAYVADCQANAIIVHEARTKTSWKVQDKTMYPYPNYGTYRIKGDSFDLMDGVLGMTLSPYVEGQDRVLFYHAMSSPTENWVLTSDLRNRTRFMHDATSSPEIFHTYEGKRTTQSAAEATDSNGIVYFGLMSDVTINCWNSNMEYGPKTTQVIADDQNTLQFASGVKVIKNRNGVQELWVMTSRFQKIGAGTLDASETNFRILAGKVDDLIYGTKCKRNKNGPIHRPGGGLGGYGLRPRQ